MESYNALDETCRGCHLFVVGASRIDPLDEEKQAAQARRDQQDQQHARQPTTVAVDLAVDVPVDRDLGRGARPQERSCVITNSRLMAR